jgi:hypothetical protein
MALQKWPTTGNTVYYTFDITNGTCNRGGSGEKVCFFVNGVSPGPTLHATWGDMVSVTVNNRMQHNETSMHWVSACFETQRFDPSDTKPARRSPVQQQWRGWSQWHHRLRNSSRRHEDLLLSSDAIRLFMVTSTLTYPDVHVDTNALL